MYNFVGQFTELEERLDLKVRVGVFLFLPSQGLTSQEEYSFPARVIHQD